MAQQASRFIGDIPKFYDEGLGPHIFVDYAEALARRVAACVSAEGADLQAVLELAAGTGIATRRLRDALPATCALVASDLNPPMLEIARAKFSEGEAVTFQQADAMALPFDAGAFDAVTCQFGVMFFPDKVGSFREVRRVLRPAGRYIFNLWDSWAANPFARITHETVAGFFSREPPGFYRVPFSYCDKALVEQDLRQAGFDEVSVETLDLEKRIPSVAAFANGLIYGNPVIEEIEAAGDIDPAEVTAALEAALRKAFGVDRGSMPLRAIFVAAQSGK